MTSTEEMIEGRPAEEVLAWSRDMIDPALRAAVGTLPAPMRRIASYHFGWRDEHDHPATGGGGKALRPALALLAAECVGGAPVRAVPAAVAVELVHNFSLLHDDVMDGDLTRRHRATAWNVFGMGPAILAGDSLLTLAFDVLADSGHPTAQEGIRTLGGTVQKLINGQSADLAFENREDVGLTECLGMVGDKTATLLGCACALGASFADGGPEQVERLRGFGEHIGLAFQLIDDLLGIWGDPEVTGKPSHSDLHNRKKSLPVVAALNSGTPAGRELAALYQRQGALTGAEMARAAELVAAAGGREWGQEQADDLLARGLRLLRSVGPPQRAMAELGTLARLITRRDH